MPATLTIEDSRRLMRLTQRLCRPQRAAGPLADATVADELTRLFNADFIGSTRWNANRRAFENAHCVGRGPEMARQYVEHFQFEDPISPRARHRREPSLVRSIVPREQLVRTCFYADFLLPFKTVDGIDLYLYQGAHNIGDLRIWRAPGRAPMGEREIALLELLRPYLLNSMLGLAEPSGDGDSVDPAKAAACRWPCFTHAPRRGARAANGAAERLCAELSPDDARDLHARVERVARSGRPSTFGEFTLCVARCSDSAAALVQLVPVLAATGAAHRLESAFGLTPREAQVCLLVAAGRSDGEIAASLKLSYWTVRTHLRKVFTKFDVASRIDLARVLATLERAPMTQ